MIDGMASKERSAVAPPYWQQWMRRPQSVWLRKALFQIHLWTGIGLGLYVVLISVSGSAIVFRNEVYKAMDQGPRRVTVQGQRLTQDQLRDIAHRDYPGYGITFLFESKRPDQATEIWLEKGGSERSACSIPIPARTSAAPFLSGSASSPGFPISIPTCSPGRRAASSTASGPS